ncbi:polysaccharide biosynthesis/export family protein [Paraburkholderia sediminicola]|uniref:polysaccharide biosynthesis/export family protein n=1 Tax=Paraburkholderia sediminicola TaxID=458836 RepID=UPI0038BA8507
MMSFSAARIKGVLSLNQGRSGTLLMTVAVLACMLLSACAVAPGMRMQKPPSIAAQNASASDENASVEAAVPMTDINLALINKLRLDAAKVSDVQTQTLFDSSPAPYRLGPGDVLQITVWDHPELVTALGGQTAANNRPSDPAQGFVIDSNGDVQFPYVGRIHLANIRLDEAQDSLIEHLSKVFVKPQVTVRIASFRSKQVYVDGEVHTPGPQPINDIPMTLLEAISRAGGFTAAADQSRMILVRRGVSYTLDLPKMMDRRENVAKILLRDGDLLRVVSRDDNGSFVMGEVNKPVTAVPMKSGRLTLSDALSQAGSLNTNSADAAQLYVIRGSQNGGVPEVYHLDARSPVAMILANQFELQPKDIVYADGNGLVRFSRVLSLLMPAINAGLTAAIVTK